MTPAEKNLFEFIRTRIEATGVSPTMQEMADAFGIRSKSPIAKRIDSLVAQGHLVRRSRAHRGIDLNRSQLSEIPTSALRAELARREQGAQA